MNFTTKKYNDEDFGMSFEIDGKLVGEITFHIEEDENLAVIENSFITESFQHKGLYPKMLCMVIENFNLNSLHSLMRSEAATKFYQKFVDILDYDQELEESGSQEDICIKKGFKLSATF